MSCDITHLPCNRHKKEYTVFARVICALFFFSILAAEKSGCVEYADFFCGGLDLGFIIIENAVRFVNIVL